LRDLTPKDPNIVILMMDSESRKRFEYDFPKSVKMLRQIQDEKKAESFEFFKHHVIGVHTRPQSKTFFTGLDRKHGKPLWKTAQERGYITGMVDTSCENLYTIFLHDYVPSTLFKKDRNDPKIPYFDYNHVEPFCTIENQDPDNLYSPTRGIFRTGRRCLIHKDEHQYVLDYFKTIGDLWPNKSKFLLSWMIQAHEITGEGLMWMDEDLEAFLQYLEGGKGSLTLDNTIFMIMGDHGNHMAAFLNVLPQGKVEAALPAMITLFPNGFLTDKGRANLKINQHRLMTLRDLHTVLLRALPWILKTIRLKMKL